MKLLRHRHKRPLRQAGFTLVEMLITMGLMSIFLLVITDVFVAVADVRNESDSTATVSEDSRYLLARLSYDVQRASAITTPASLGGTGSTLGLTIGGTAYTYSVVSGNLQIANPTVSNLNSSETTISGLSVQKLGNSGGKETVRLSLTITSKARQSQGTTSKTLTTTVGVR